MQPGDVVRVLADDYGISRIELSRKLGRSDFFISNYISTGRLPRIELLAEICDATGHDLLVRNRTTGREIIIDPPRKDNDEA